MSTEMCRSTYSISVEHRSICRPICWPICWPICRPGVIVRLWADMSIDRIPTFRRYFTATCPGCVIWNKIHIASYHYLRTFWERCLPLPASQRIFLYKSSVVNRTNLTKNQLNSIEPNRPDYCSIGSVIAQNRAGIFRRVRLIELVRSITEVNRTRSTRFLGRKTKPIQFHLNLD